jgi:hypothetical protein
MNTEGTEIGPQTETLLQEAIRHQQHTQTHLVVAAGFDPDIPGQTVSLAKMMARRLRELGVENIEVLEADHFSTFGELTAYRDFLSQKKYTKREVLGYSWHLRRVAFEARLVGGKRWAKEMKFVSVPDSPSIFDRFIEIPKWLKLILPRHLQVKAITIWKRRISRRTSY